MTYLEDLWQNMFEREITPVEAAVMSSVMKQVDRDNRVATLAAILVRMLYVVLVEDKESPLSVLRRFSQAMEENRRRTVLISETYERLQEDLANFEGTVTEARNALRDARDMARKAYGSYHGLYGFLPAFTGHSGGHFSATRTAMLIGACFVAAMLGCTICFMIFLG